MTVNCRWWFVRCIVAATMALLLGVCFSPVTVCQGGDITNVAVDVWSYPDTDNYTFKSGVGNTGQLILHSASSDSILTGNLTLERDGVVQYFNTDHNTFLGVDPSTSPYTLSAVTLGGSNLLLENNGASSGTAVTNVFLGKLSGAGTITVQGNHPEDPESQQAILHLTGASLTPSSSITFNIAGGGLSVDNPNALPNTVTLNSTYSASLILPTTGATIGSGFTYHLQGTTGCTNIGGSILVGTFLGSGAAQSADVTYNGQITYNNTNYIDSLNREWGKASVIVGVGSLTFSNAAFANTDALAIGGGYNYMTGHADSSVWTTLNVADQANLVSLPKNLGLCGGKIDLSSLGGTVDLTGYKLCAIAIAVRDGDPYPGGGSVIVTGAQPVTLKINGADLMTDNGIVSLERKTGTGSSAITVEINCQGGAVDPNKFAGFKLPAGSLLKFTNFTGTTAATGNIEGAGTVNAEGKSLAVGSAVSTSEAFTGTIQNVDTLQKVGSATTNIGSGATVTANSAEVQQGNLAVQSGATFSVGTLTVEDGGVLSGNGTIQGDVTISDGGWLTPGNSINSHTTAGNLTIQANGGIQIQTVALGASQTVGNPGADNDVERVTGRLAFQSNARILVTKDSTSTGTYKTGDKYYAIVAGQGVDNLSAAKVTDDIAGVAVRNYGVEHGTHAIGGVDVTGDWFWFDLTRGFSASTPNGRRLSDYLVAAYDAGQLSTLYTTLDGLTSDEQSAALQRLSGESLATSQSLSLDGTMIFTHMLHNRIRPGSLADGQNTDTAYRSRSNLLLVSRQDNSSPRWNGWTTGYGVGGSIHGNSDTTATGLSMGGVLVGIDRELADDTKLGFFYNYGHNTGRQSSLDASTEVDDYFFGAYLTDRHDGWYWLSTAGAGYDRYQSSRQVAFGSVNELAQADYSGWQSQVYGEAGLELGRGNTSLQPYFGLQYIYLRGNGLGENTATAPNSALVGDGADYNALQTHLGGRIAQTFSLAGRPSSIEFRSAWLHQLLHDTAPVLNAHFAAAPGSGAFSVVGADLARDWCWLGSGLQCRLAERVTLFADYDMLLNTAQTIHTGSGGLLVMW